MSLLTLSNIQHSYGTHRVLDGATVSIEAGEKVGLVGRNGGGKTTLMKVMVGQLKPDAGTISIARGARTGYMSQEPVFDPEDTLRDAAERAFAELHDLHVQAHALYDKMAHAEGEALEKLLKQQAVLDAKIEAAGGYAIDHRIDAMLHGLGFTDEEFTRKVGVLSGGQRGRLGLARLLLEEPDLLLLDEPTNHLDIAGRRWLENFLAEEYHGAVIVVSHDRWLLDRVVTRIIEVERGQIREYPGNYEKYVALRAERQLTEARVYDKQQDRIRSEKQFIMRYKAGQRAKQARGRATRLERFIRDEVTDRPIELGVMNLNLPKAPRTGDMVISAQGIGKTYGDTTLFENFDVSIMRGERIGIIGPNGAGKTTLIKCLLGELEVDAGEVRQGSRLVVGHYRQLHDHLDPSLTVWQYLQGVIVAMDGSARASEQQARDLAGAFLFSGADQDKTFGVLSGGERSRAVIAGLVAAARNVLVLDEPTNHLDIPSAERLEDVLSDEEAFGGTLLLITHDRALLESTCNRLIVLDGKGGARVFEGSYSEWERKAQEADAPKPAPPPPAARKPASPKPVIERAASNGAAAKATSKTRGKAKGLEALATDELERRIMELEKRIAVLDESLCDPRVYADRDRFHTTRGDREKAAAELQPLEAEWLRRGEGDE